MAITINGSGTIGGVSVGGLPDGIVDTDVLANDAVTSAKIGSLPAGSVLQVVSFTTTGQTATTSTTDTDTVVTANITPSSASSKILAIFFGSVRKGITSGDVNNGANIKLKRNSTVLAIQQYVAWNQLNSYAQETTNIIYLDSPNTTSQLTYTITIALTIAAGGGVQLGHDSGVIGITLLEIAA